MGKKRRLNASKAKFNIKHANHPRMKHLNSQEETVAEVVVEATPEAILQEETLEEMPKVAPKRKRARKVSTKRRPQKKTTAPEATT